MTDLYPPARRCTACGEAFRVPHNCGFARQARALFEAAKRANDPASRDTLSRRALDMAEAAERAAV